MGKVITTVVLFFVGDEACVADSVVRTCGVLNAAEYKLFRNIMYHANHNHVLFQQLHAMTSAVNWHRVCETVVLYTDAAHSPQ